MRRTRKSMAAMRLHPVCLAAMLAFWGACTQAQVATPPSAAASAAVAVAEVAVCVVMITAQCRSEQAQKVPVAVTALSASEMESKQIDRMDDLKYEVPNVVIEQNTVRSSGAKIFMRGVGTGDSLFTSGPLVAIYIDDMYVAHQTGALFDMFDLQRVEVLRGPQGTLYRRNATGGAIRYVTKKPSGESRLEVEPRAGNLGRLDLSLNGGGRFSEGQAVNFGLMSKSRDGYLRGVNNGRDANDEELVGTRVSFAWDVSQSTSVRLSIDTLRQTSGPTYASGAIDPVLEAKYGRPVNNPDSNLYTIETDLLNGINDLDQTDDSFSTSTDMGAFEWRNAPTYRQMNNELYADMGGTAQKRFHLYQDQVQKQGSYETQLVSNGKRPLSWTTGLFMFREKNWQPTRQDKFVTSGFDIASLGIADVYLNVPCTYGLDLRYRFW